MKISYVTTYDATDVHNWSGLGYNIANSLKSQGAELDYIGNLETRPGLLLKLKKYGYYAMGKSFPYDREPSVLRHYAAQVQNRLKSDSDVVFSPGSLPVTLLKTDRPLVFYTDATFAGMMNFYDGFKKMSRESIKHGLDMEQKALDNCAFAIFASDWAAKTAIENYRVDPAKVKVVPFGANIEVNRKLPDIQRIIDARDRTKCRLLFVGVEWERKGGDLALEVAKKLNENGVPTELHVVGLEKIPLPSLPPFVIQHGFLSKSNKDELKKLEDLYLKSHFFILPSRAEAFGVVFAEASSFGMPSLARAVGGMTTAIRNDINGKTFPQTATADDYANFILAYFTDEKAYNELAISSFGDYENRLNWKVSGKTLMELLGTLC